MAKYQFDTTEEISKRMSKVKTKRNIPERMLAKALWHKGYRYRLNDKRYPGSPDIVLSKYQIAIFVDGEFWHGKDFEAYKEKYLHHNREYWIEKIERNIARDRQNDQKLRAMGMIPLHFWGKDVCGACEYCVEVIEEYVRHQVRGMEDVED